MPNIGRPGGPGHGGGPGGPMAARINGQKPKNLGKTLGRLFSYIGASRAILIALLVLVLVVTGVDIVGPALQGKAIDTITIVDGKFRVDLDAMKKYLLLMGIIFAFSALVTYVQSLLSARLAQNTVYRMRNDLFKKISRGILREKNSESSITEKACALPCGTVITSPAVMGYLSSPIL